MLDGDVYRCGYHEWRREVQHVGHSAERTPVDMQGTGLDPDVLRGVVETLVEVAQPTRIMLFGSRARGEQGQDSDLDLLVIKETVPDRLREMVRLRRALASVLLPIDILVYSEEEVREQESWLGTPLYEALREGRALYARG